jgi:hypothetical protein
LILSKEGFAASEAFLKIQVNRIFFHNAPRMEGAAPKVVVAFFSLRRFVETQNLATLHVEKKRHGTLAFGGASPHSVASGSIFLRSTGKGAQIFTRHPESQA